MEIAYIECTLNHEEYVICIGMVGILISLRTSICIDDYNIIYYINKIEKHIIYRTIILSFKKRMFVPIFHSGSNLMVCLIHVI